MKPYVCVWMCMQCARLFTVTWLCFHIVYSSFPISHGLLRITIILTINCFINTVPLELCQKGSHSCIAGYKSNVQDLKKITLLLPSRISFFGFNIKRHFFPANWHMPLIFFNFLQRRTW